MNNEQQLQQTMDRLIAPFTTCVAIAATGAFHYTHRQHVLLPSASLIKLPILLYAMNKQQMDSGFFERRIAVKSRQCVGGSGVLQVLSPRTWSVRDLLALMICVSDNTATNVLIDAFGLHNLQHWISESPLPGTVLARRLMDRHAAPSPDNFISAAAACRCLETIMAGCDRLPEIGDWLLHQQFRDKLPGLFDETPCPVRVYNKTGEMEAVDHDTACFSLGGNCIFIAVLTHGLPDRQTALKLHQTIGRLVADYLLAMQNA
ncbi:MAG: serine hydrolase [Sporolactobacillus sp.]